MKPRTFFSTTALLGVALLTTSAFAVPEGWTDDYEAARTEAASSDKDLLLDFTGSDWCGWCIKLREEVFDTEAFKNQAFDDFVMVEVDFPNDVPQTDEVKAQNAELGQKFNVQGYPTIILADATGKPYAQTGYQPGGADSYLAHLDQLQAKRQARDAAMAEAESAEGIEKAKALDTAIEAVGLELAAGHYRETIDQIIELDADDEAGLKSKYESIQNVGQIDAEMQAAIGMFEAGDMEGGLAHIDMVLKDYELMPEQAQIINAVRGQALLQMGRTDAAIESLEAAIQASPDSQVVPQIKEYIAQIKQSQATPAAE